MAEASTSSGLEVAQASEDDDSAAVDLERVRGVQRSVHRSGVRIPVRFIGGDRSRASAVHGIPVLLCDLRIPIRVLWIICCFRRTQPHDSSKAHG